MQSRTLTAALAGTVLALGMTTALAQTNPAPADAPTNAPKAGTDAMPADGNAEGAKPKANHKKSHHAKSSRKSGGSGSASAGDTSDAGKASGGNDAAAGAGTAPAGAAKQSQ